MPDRLFDYEHWGTGVLSADTNMALEEYLLKRVAEQKSFAAMRFYSFARDTIVLGYAQANDAVKRLDAGVELTRRITGGSHVQTGKNIVAYSFVVPRDGSFRHFEDMRAYYAERVANSLGNIGIESVTVDNKASTINVGGRIIASHAIFWGVNSALLHGLIHLTPYDVDRIAERVMLQQRQIGSHTYSEYAALKNLPTVATELNGRISGNRIKDHVLRQLVSDAISQEVTGGHFEKKQIDDNVMARSSELFQKRYGTPLWVNEHRPTFTPVEVEAIPGEELDGPLRKNLGYCLFIQVPDSDFKEMSEPVE
ncbi:MAG: lipoate--protein ligase family protein [Candidatus Aenigmarchaeota archaeon]|nr:lipoate--protein ligase family protein [Candidatus Aenigmarchaeota archaeon]